MKRSLRLRSLIRRARQRGVIGGMVDEAFASAAILACFVAPVAAASRNVGPRLADEMDQRIHTVSAQDPGKVGGLEPGALGELGSGMDFGGTVERIGNAAMDFGGRPTGTARPGPGPTSAPPVDPPRPNEQP